MEKVSVIITAYNIEKYIEECVRSVIEQTLKDIRIICVDDCSVDNTASILKCLKKEDDRIDLIIHSDNMGLATSRVDGYERAKGKYVYIMDGDDMLTPRALEIMYNTAEKEQLDILSFEGQVFYDDDEMRKKYNSKHDYYIRKGNYFEVPVCGACLFSHYMKNGDMSGNIAFQFIRKDYVKKKEFIGLSGIRYGESPLALYLTADRAMCISDQLYLRRFRAGSDVTTPFNRIKIESMIIQYDFDFNMFYSYANEIKVYSEWVMDYLYFNFRSIISQYSEYPFDINEIELLQNYPTALFIFENIIKHIDRRELYYDKLGEKEIQELKNEDTIIVYGNGKVASLLIAKLEDEGIHDYFIATTMGEKEENGKRKVYCIDELLEYRNTGLVLIAVNWANKRDIRYLLQKKGFMRVKEISRG